MYLDRAKYEYRRKADAKVCLLLLILTVLLAAASVIAEK